MRQPPALFCSLLAALTMLGCVQNPSAVKPSGASASVAASDNKASTQSVPAQLNALYDAFWEDTLKLNPLAATQQGDSRYNDQLNNNLSGAYREQAKALQQRYLDQARGIVGSHALSGQDALNFEIFTRARTRELAQWRFPRHLMPLNQFFSFANQFVVLGSGSNAQPFNTVADYDNWLKRADKIPMIFDQAIENMREGVRLGYVQPAVLMQRTLPQLAQQLVDKPEDSLFYGPLKNFPASIPEPERTRLTTAYRALISEILVPSYRKLHNFVKDEYLPKCRNTSGLGALPEGSAWYAQLVRENTTTDLTPDQIHQIGLEEVARIHGEMRNVMQTLNFKGDLKAFFKAVQNDPKQIFASEADLLSAYRDFRAEVEPKLNTLFDLRPKGDFEIRPVEAFRAASSSSGSYQRAPEDRSRPGIFYVNTFDLSARPKRALESLYLHEATPGHHFQIALQQESETMPKFRRFGGETAFSEGWGLYSESLGKELGVYRDPMMYFGALEADLWRAIRLVADTGLHAKGWSREQVLAYVYENSATETTRAQSETERFMAIPGQALAYKIGQLRIRELRTRAETALGTRFDVRAFHNEVLRDGAVPLDILENKIDAWIAERKSPAVQ
jgi:uncharacterized protein (DUF885 family)